MQIKIKNEKLRNIAFYSLIILPTLIACIIVMVAFIQNMNSQKSLRLTNLQLYVKDLSSQKDFYTNLVGLEVMKQTDKSVQLGSNDVVIELLQEDEYTFPSFSDAGLYHSALVYKTRSQLASTIAGILETRPDLYVGSSDHGATEAFYFEDIEGNGVELYFDKPLSEVSFDNRGKPIMGSVYINEQSYIQKYFNEENTKPEIHIGHIHLRIGNIPEAKTFYVNALKFDLMNEMPNALFVSKDNYHHHLGMNTWESLGAAKRSPLKYGLKSFKIEYLDTSLFEDVIKTLKESNYTLEEISEVTYIVNDPWNNKIYLERL